MNKPLITGYCDRLSVKPGDTLRFMLSAEGTTGAEAQLVRLIHGDENPIGPGFLEEEIAASCNGPVTLAQQYSQMGSFIEIPDPEGRALPEGSFTLHALICPTLPGKGRQAILTQSLSLEATGFALLINEQGYLTLWLGDGERTAEVTADKRLMARNWYLVAASVNPQSGKVALYQQPVLGAYNNLHSVVVPRDDGVFLTRELSLTPKACARPVLLAGEHARHHALGDVVGALYNGKIDRCGIVRGELSRTDLDIIRDGGVPPAEAVHTYWDTTAGYTDHGIDDRLIDTGPLALHGLGRNRPVRAMTGYNWSGRDDCFRLNPAQYGGIEFHEDAIIDSGWCPSLEWQVPEGLKSGVYALRLRSGETEDHVVFFLRPTTPQASVAMLMPTASYLAYANERFVIDTPGVEVVTGHPLVLYDWDYALAAHPEWGRSSYDHYRDGAGVSYSSYLRPIMGLRPKHRMAATNVPWQFAADLSIVCWLEQQGFAYDVITDEDLHREGVSCLAPYAAVLNGTHSEYYSERMLDATEQYVAAGGRVMYLGANGYYWVVAFREEEPWCMEIRKLDAGSRAWQAAPGEYYMATTGEKGGIWRNRGRAPQKLTGVGFASEGMDQSRAYQRLPDSHDPAVNWVFEGVTQTRFGDFGLGQNGAAGLEIDRYDLSLGTPPGTYLLATSEPFSDAYPHVVEEIMFNFPGLGGTQDFQVRADVTLFAAINGGAMFSTGSIAWGQALPCNGGDNDVSKITANVLRRFVNQGPITD